MVDVSLNGKSRLRGEKRRAAGGEVQCKEQKVGSAQIRVGPLPSSVHTPLHTLHACTPLEHSHTHYQVSTLFQTARAHQSSSARRSKPHGAAGDCQKRSPAVYSTLPPVHLHLLQSLPLSVCLYPPVHPALHPFIPPIQLVVPQCCVTSISRAPLSRLTVGCRSCERCPL